MNLSPNFTLEEFTTSDTAKSKNIDNTPSTIIIENLKLLCINVLEPLRGIINRPLYISSGYRCEQLNIAIGGSKTSQHMGGKAADLKCKGLSTEDLYKEIIKSGIQFDQLIQEFNRWCHISWNDSHNRNEKIRATKDENNNTVYTIEK